jgi:hypothetical protein
VADQRPGADPGQVIEVMANQIGELSKQLATASVIIRDQDAVIEAYKAAAANSGQEVST